MDVETAMTYVEYQFNEMDRNNQRNLLWNMAGAGRGYDNSKFHYRDSALALLASCTVIAPQIGAERLTRMAQTLSDRGFGSKIKFQELIGAA